MKKIATMLPRLTLSQQCISGPEGYGPDTYAPADGEKINQNVDTLNLPAI